MSQCRFCNHPLKYTFCDLGNTPPSNSYLKDLNRKEVRFPLHALICESCFLVQLAQYQSPSDIFSDYAYFSSFSDSWIAHAKEYVEMVIDRFHLNEKSHVVEVASNDGYLLQHFKERHIPHLGVEPAKNIAKHAREKGIKTINEFFGLQLATELAEKYGKASLLLGNNVLAHVPDLNDFVKGFKELLSPSGVITFEFPHLLQLIAQNQFDTIYHEHFSYFSLFSVEKVLEKQGLELFDVEEIKTHGGSLRIYAQHRGYNRAKEKRLQSLRDKEKAFGLESLKTYLTYDQRVTKSKEELLNFFSMAKKEKKTVVGYGAPAKGNTLLNYCGVSPKMLSFTVDRSPHKQGHFLPGTHVPIYHPEKIKEEKPDYILILPWNLKEEIMEQMSYVREWGAKWVVPVPTLQIFE